MKLYCLPGFLGHPSDWDFLQDAGFEVTSSEYFNGRDVPTLEETADGLVADLTPEFVLLGYSAGGRLALEALIRGARVRSAILVSTGLAIEGQTERSRRLAADEVWASRFETEAWNPLLRDWNAQAVFDGHEMPRDERLYQRSALASALRKWSPAAQQPLAGRLHTIRTPTLCVAGSRDPKYVAEAQRAVGLMPAAELSIIEGVGHRVPWEDPAAFIDRLRAFLD